MKRPNFEPIFEEKRDFCEISSNKPVKTFVPNQAISISELIERFESGKRLGVHCNFAPGSNFDNISEEEAFARIKSDDMDADDFPPTGVHDITDVEAHYQAHLAHKADFSARQKKKIEESQQAKKKAQQDEPTPPTPPAE